MKFFVYILFSTSINRYYIGQTYDINVRLQKHFLKTTHYTKQADDWEIVYTEEFNTKAEAMKRESFIKKQKSSKFIRTLIINKNSG